MLTILCLCCISTSFGNVILLRSYLVSVFQSLFAKFTVTQFTVWLVWKKIIPSQMIVQEKHNSKNKLASWADERRKLLHIEHLADLSMLHFENSLSSLFGIFIKMKTLQDKRSLQKIWILLRTSLSLIYFL